MTLILEKAIKRMLEKKKSQVVTQNGSTALLSVWDSGSSSPLLCGPQLSKSRHHKELRSLKYKDLYLETEESFM